MHFVRFSATANLLQSGAGNGVLRGRRFIPLPASAQFCWKTPMCRFTTTGTVFIGTPLTTFFILAVPRGETGREGDATSPRTNAGTPYATNTAF